MTEASTGEAPAGTARALTDELKTEIRDTFEALKKSMPGFRTRRSQNYMVGLCSRTFATPGAVAVVEAPTGTGKSLSYLTAGVPVGQAHKLKLIIATGTVALQEQLADRDIPLFLQATKYPRRPMLAKGRQRFLCPRNSFGLSATGAQESISFGNDDDDLATPTWARAPKAGEVDLVGRLNRAWDDGKWDGDLDKAPETIDPDLRSMLSCSASACSNKRCEFVERCPFKLARKSLDTADIVVVNHALLLSDLQVVGEEEGEFGGVVLPKLSESIVVIDEGHNLAETAREMLSSTVQATAAHKLLLKLRKVMRASYQTIGRDKVANKTLQDGLQLLGELDNAWSSFEKVVRYAWVPDASDRDRPMWLAKLGHVPEDWRVHVIELARLARLSFAWVRGVRRALLDEDDLPAGAKDVLPRELGVGVERLDAQQRLWQLWADEARANATPTAKWITLEEKGDGLIFNAGTVSAADYLRERLFGQAAAVVVTSATISAGGDFTAVARDLGLPDAAEVASLPSPFDLRAKGKLIIPPLKTNAKAGEEHTTEVAQWLAKNLDWNAGNLVLLTSKVKLAGVYAKLPLAKQAMCRVQGSKSKTRLLEEHAAAIAKGAGSTILALSGWGEGLDMPGALCTNVVITSLPFTPPVDPLQKTLSDWLESQGRRPFDEISVPEATRKLTQFMGRLLRHEDDEGTIYVLDRRLADTRYGKRMLQALPPFSVQTS